MFERGAIEHMERVRRVALIRGDPIAGRITTRVKCDPLGLLGKQSATERLSGEPTLEIVDLEVRVALLLFGDHDATLCAVGDDRLRHANHAGTRSIAETSHVLRTQRSFDDTHAKL